MKRSKPLWVLVAIFIVILSLWLASGQYPYPVYEYHQTGEVIEWFDRAAGLEVDAVPIFVPNNPPWVNVVRRIAPITLFVGGLAILYVLIERRNKKLEHPC